MSNKPSARMISVTTFAVLLQLVATACSRDDEPAYVYDRNASGEIVVDERNFTIAETDLYMLNHSQEHPVNTFRHAREMSSVENQFVVRENRDVLYSHAVVDISEGATLVNPDWDVFSVIQVIDENQYTIASIYAGTSPTGSTSPAGGTSSCACTARARRS